MEPPPASSGLADRVRHGSGADLVRDDLLGCARPTISVAGGFRFGIRRRQAVGPGCSTCGERSTSGGCSITDDGEPDDGGYFAVVVRSGSIGGGRRGRDFRA
ncbi:hypothetical protein AB6813_13070 [bacterium RCC_150]